MVALLLGGYVTTTTKPVRRETFSSIRERGKFRPIVITLDSTFVTVKLKGMRYAYTVTYAQILNIGARNAAEQLRAAKAEARKARRPA